MGAQQIGEAFGRAVQWAGLLGLGGVALAALALSLARLRRNFRACPPLRRTLAALAVAVGSPCWLIWYNARLKVDYSSCGKAVEWTMK